MEESGSRGTIQSAIRSAFEELGLPPGGRRIAILAGAGASFGSGLPTAAGLSRSLLEEAGLAPEKLKRILDRELPLERILQTIFTEVSEPGLLGLFALGRPSRLHRAVAELWAAKVIASIYTTNFDELFEEALARVWQTRPYARLVLGTDVAQKGRLSLSLAGHVVKLHGTVSEESSLQSTIKSVGSGRNRASIISPITELFVEGQHDLIVSVGYSYSDRFDINPVLAGLPDGKPVILLKHSAQVAEPVATQSLGVDHPLSRMRGVIVSGPPAEILMEIGRACGISHQLSLGEEPIPAEWVTSVRNWFSQQGAWRLPISGLIRANLFLNAGDVESAFREFRSGHRAIRTFVLPEVAGEGDARLAARMEGMYLWGIFRTSDGRIPDQERLELLVRCGVLIEGDAKPFEVANVLVALGTLERRLGDFSAASSHLNQAIDHCRGLPDQAQNIGAFIQLSEVFRDEGNLIEAARLLQIALRLAESQGSLEQVVGTLARLADLASMQGDNEGAQRLANEARHLAAGLKSPILLASLQSWKPGGKLTGFW